MSEVDEYKYYDGRENYYLSDRGINELKAVLNEIDEKDKVLDVGCGIGMSIRVMKDLRKDLSIKGIDTNTMAIGLAKGNGVDAIVGDFLEYPFTKNEFDVVIGLSVLSFIDVEKLIMKGLEISKKVLLLNNLVEIKSLTQNSRPIFNFHQGMIQLNSQNLKGKFNENFKLNCVSTKLYDYNKIDGTSDSVYLLKFERITKEKNIKSKEVD